MSYCRFSTDDYQCDVYVYEDVSGGWTTHVASNRVTPPGETRPPPIGAWWDRGEAGVADFMDRDKLVTAWLETGERRPIGLPHDGGSFNDQDPGACADRLESLRAIGYNVPQSAIDALREEASDLAREGSLVGREPDSDRRAEPERQEPGPEDAPKESSPRREG